MKSWMSIFHIALIFDHADLRHLLMNRKYHLNKSSWVFSVLMVNVNHEIDFKPALILILHLTIPTWLSHKS